MRLYIQENEIVYEQDPKNKWSIKIDNLKFIGEYTTAEGPLADDYFFVFAEKVDEWWQAPSLAVDHGKFWIELGKKLNIEIAPELFGSTIWASRVIYPKNLEGQELYRIVKTEPKRKSLFQKLFGLEDSDERIELTENVSKLFIE